MSQPGQNKTDYRMAAVPFIGSVKQTRVRAGYQSVLVEREVVFEEHGDGKKTSTAND
jgi:hypothetical protein